MLMDRPGVWVAVETFAGPVELELIPSVEIPTSWSKKARWPPCLRRWPSAERVQCIKVSACGASAPQRCSWLNQPQHH